MNGCTCMACCEKHCICDNADWTPKEVLRLRAENERLRQNVAAIEDEKNNYMEYVGDALGQADDGETLWDAAQRVLSERDRLRAENEALRRYANHTNDCNLSSIYQFVALRGCNCGFDALAAKGE